MVFFIKSYSYETFIASSRGPPKKGPFDKEMSTTFLMTLYSKPL